MRPPRSDLRSFRGRFAQWCPLAWVLVAALGIGCAGADDSGPMSGAGGMRATGGAVGSGGSTGSGGAVGSGGSTSSGGSAARAECLVISARGIS
jgi:hypothetical protein